MKAVPLALSLVEPEARGTCAACYLPLSHSRSQKTSESCLTLEKKSIDFKMRAWLEQGSVNLSRSNSFL